MITKFIVFSLLITLCVARYNQPKFIRFFNDALYRAMGKHTYIGSYKAVQPANPLKATTVTVTFPEYLHSPPNEDLIIKSIQQLDYGEHQAKVRFLEGGIGSNQVKLAVTVPEGVEMGTEFHFFGEKIVKITSAEKMKAYFMKKFVFPETDQAKYVGQDKPIEKHAAAKSMQ